MTSFVISMRCSPQVGRWGRGLCQGLLALILAAVALLPVAYTTQAQDDALAGVRGNLYESPTLGFLVFLPQDSGWQFLTTSSDAGGDLVQVEHPSGITETVFGYRDAEADAAACAQRFIGALAESYPAAEFTGWHDDEVSIETDDTGTAISRVLVPDPAGDDLFVFISCLERPEDLLLGSMQIQPNSAVEGGEVPESLIVQPPGLGNTGRPHLAGEAGPGVVLFAARWQPVLAGEVAQPFSCLDQESFALPSGFPPEGLGAFACDGQVVNVDDQTVDLSLEGFAIGCQPGLPVDPDAGACPPEPVLASHVEVFETTGEVAGTTLTLDPGEQADLVLWFALPEGVPPQDVLYLEGEHSFQVGPSSFGAGIGSRPRVRMVR